MFTAETLWGGRLGKEGAGREGNKNKVWNSQDGKGREGEGVVKG